MKTVVSHTIKTVMGQGLEYIETYSDGSVERYAFGIQRESGRWIVYVPPGKGATFEPSWTDDERERISPRIVAHFARPGCFGLMPPSEVEFKTRRERLHLSDHQRSGT